MVSEFTCLNIQTKISECEWKELKRALTNQQQNWIIATFSISLNERAVKFEYGDDYKSTTKTKKKLKIKWKAIKYIKEKKKERKSSQWIES